MPELRIFGTTPCHYCPILARQRKRLMLRIFQPVHEPRFLFGLNNNRYYRRASTDFLPMAGAEGLEPSARGFGGNVEISLTLRLLPDFGDLLPAAPLMLQELMLF